MEFVSGGRGVGWNPYKRVLVALFLGVKESMFDTSRSYRMFSLKTSLAEAFSALLGT